MQLGDNDFAQQLKTIYTYKNTLHKDKKLHIIRNIPIGMTNDGLSQYEQYVKFINSVLSVIRHGECDYVFFDYQIEELLRFEPDLQFTYNDTDEFFTVWLEETK